MVNVIINGYLTL